MALTKCKECGHDISNSAKVCPNCGAKIRRTGLFTKLVAGFFGLVVLMAIFGKNEPGGSTSSSASSASSKPTSTASTVPETPEMARIRLEQDARAAGLRWRYNDGPDPMGRGTVKQAEVLSVNQVSFEFPYRGLQRGALTLRTHPKYGKDVILSIDKGQFLCSVGGCSVSVRFDDGKAQTFSASGPEDHSTTTLFIRGYDKFVAATRKAKKVYIEAQFFQQGNRVFEFDVSDLNWKP